MAGQSYIDLCLEINALKDTIDKYIAWELECMKNPSRKNRARALLVKKIMPSATLQLKVMTHKLSIAPKRDVAAIDADIEIVKSKIIAITGNYPVMCDGRNSWHDSQDDKSKQYRELNNRIMILFREREYAMS